MHIINPMAAGDIAYLNGISKECGFLNWDEDDLKAELLKKNISYFFTGRYFNETVSFGGFWLINKQAHLVVLGVKKDFRRKGAAEKLLNYIINYASGLQTDSIILDVAENNFPARYLYEKAGFFIGVVKKNYYGSRENAVSYILKLKDRMKAVRIN